MILTVRDLLMKSVLFFLIICCVYPISGSFILITTLYNETNPERIEEYLTCLKRNLAHPLIEKIHVMYDVIKDDEGPTHVLNFIKEHGIEITYIRDRVTYQQCFDLANAQYHKKRILLSNGDIYFNETLSKLVGYNLRKKFLVLTRWETNKDGSLSKQYGWHGKALTCSQDVWVFDTPLREFSNAHIKLGILGCDCAIAKQAQLAGLKVLNPCLTIQCCHLHTSNVRNYPHKGYSDFVETEWSHL